MNSSTQVNVEVYDEPAAFCFSIRDAGTGFDYQNLPDPTAPENIEKENGRGIYLMRHLADDVEFNPEGNCVTVCFNK